MKKLILALNCAFFTILLATPYAIELPPSLTPLHHWDAYNPNGDGSQIADGTTITNLLDLVGGNHAILIAGAPTYKAGDPTTIGGQPSIRFTTADGLRAPTAITNTTYTIFSVSKLNGGTNQRLITSTNPANYLLGYWAGSENRAYNGAFFGTLQPATTNRHMYIHQAMSDGTDRLQDADVIIPNGDGAGGAGAIGPLGFGGINWSAGEASDGDISEIIIFDSDMDPNDFTAVGFYLAQKYGFTAFGHDGTVVGGGPDGPSDFTWTNGSGNHLWNDDLNWFGGTVPGINDTALIETNAVPGAIDLTNAPPVGRVTFRPGASGFSLVNGSLTAGAITHISGGTNEIAAALNGVNQLFMSGGQLTLSGELLLDVPLIATGIQGSLRINSVIGGTHTFTKTGKTSVELQSNNTFTGDLEIQSGSVHISADGALGATNGVTWVQAGASLVLADGLTYITPETIGLIGKLTTDGTATLGPNVRLRPSSCATITAEQPGHQLTVLADLAFRCLNISGDGLVELAGTLSSAPTSLNLNAINDQPTGTYPVAADGTNFTAYVDNDGVYSWLLIGRGREGWEFDNDGQGAIADLGQGLGTTNAFAPAAYRASIINDLLSQAGMTPRDLEIRIKRAMDPAGTLYQEARWRLPSRTTWSWIFENSFPAQHRILSGNTSPYMNNNSNTRDTPAVDNGIERIFTWPWTGHGFMKGFSYGAAITNGTNNLTSFLWESADEDHSLPYTEVYIRGDQSEGLHKNGSGTLVLLGTNTYDLATYVNDGVLELRTEGALGDPAVATIIKDGATLGFGAGISQTSIENIEIRYDGDGGSIVNLSGDNAHAGPVTVAGALTAAVSDFYGGDPGEGLDLDGDFLYAVNARGPGGLPVRDAVFSDEASEPNVMISAQNEVLNWQNPQLGDSPDDDNLEVVMQSIRWHPAPRSLTAQIKGLTLGAPYKLQLLFYEPNIAGRGFDAHLDQMVAATRFADDFTTGVGGPGRVLTLEFVATDTTHTVILNGNGAPFNDHNPILQALTLEQNIPETGFPGHARIAANAGSLTLTGPVALGKSSVQLGGAGAVFISSGLTGAQESGLHKVDSGTATLSGDNTGLLGNITVDGGTLIAASNTALGNGQETRVNAGGTLGLEGGIQVANQRLVLIGANALENLADTNTVAASSSISGTLADIGIRASTGTLIIDAPIELGYHALLVDGNADAVINGPIDGATPGALISFEQTVINANPLAYYTFDNLVDTNTLANDGSLTNSAEILGAASIAPALHGNGLAMVDGSNSLVEVNFPDTLIANAIKLPVNGNYSLGGWFNGLHDISEYRTFSRATSGDHHALIETGTHRLGMFQGGFQYSGYNVDGTAGPAIDARSGWHFFVVVGHEDNTTDYYIDNTYVGTVPRTSRSDVWRIGAWPGQTFANLIDDFFVFDRSLSDAEIDQLWRAQDGLTTSNRVVKSGAGTLTLAGDNHYRDGTRILGGTLSVDNLSGSGTGTSNVVVEAGATLAGDGSIVGAVEILAGATLAPGGIPGELAIAGGVQFTDVGTVFAVDLLGPGLSPLEFDRIISGGILSLNGTLALTRDPGYTPNNSQSLVIATANSLSGTFAGIIEGATVLDNLNTEYIISYQGSAVTLTPVDPPAEGFDVSTLSYAPGPGTNQSSFTLAWASSSGTTYRIESAPHPEGPWTPLTTGITGQAGMTLHTEVLNNVAGVKRLYLRVGAE